MGARREKLIIFTVALFGALLVIAWAIGEPWGSIVLAICGVALIIKIQPQALKTKNFEEKEKFKQWTREHEAEKAASEKSDQD